MTVELGTVLHGASVLAESLDRTLESFTFGNTGSIDSLAYFKDISLDLFAEFVFFCIFKTELSDISLCRNVRFFKVSHLGLVHAVAVNDLFPAALILVDDSFLFVNEAYLPYLPGCFPLRGAAFSFAAVSRCPQRLYFAPACSY